MLKSTKTNDLIGSESLVIMIPLELALVTRKLLSVGVDMLENREDATLFIKSLSDEILFSLKPFHPWELQMLDNIKIPLIWYLEGVDIYLDDRWIGCSIMKSL